MPIIELHEMEGDYFFGIIVLDPFSPYEWENQCGGTACAHPRATGVFIPLPGHWMPDEDTLTDLWLTDSRDEDMASGVGQRARRFIESSDWLNFHFELRAGVYPLGEAWIPVVVSPNCTEGVLAPFAGQAGLLTYANSD